MSTSQSTNSLESGRTSSGIAVVPISTKSAANGSMDAEQLLTRVEITGDSAKLLTDALFVLWLRIAATLVLARLVMLVWPVNILLILSLMLVATFNPLIRRMQQRLTRAIAIATIVLIGYVSYHQIESH